MGILAVLLGIVAAACALMATFLFGTTGGIVAGVLAAAAIVLGFVKRKKDGRGGVPGIVVGALALLMAFSLTSVWSMTFRTLHETAVQYKPDGLWAQVTESFDSGVTGIMQRLPSQDESTIKALTDEMNELNALAAK